MKRIIRKRKALILNDEDKILTFIEDRSNYAKLTYPSIYAGNEISILEEEYLDHYEFVDSTTKDKVLCTSVNNKLIKEEVRKIKIYYYIKHLLTEEEFELLSSACPSDVRLDYLSIEEIKEFIETKYRDEFIKKQNLKPILALEKRLRKGDYKC